ncbi:MAG: hypothetical protein U0936_11450 [Planctomycetaceae bacterium]
MTDSAQHGWNSGPAAQLCDIAEKFDSTVIVDEAHGTGVFGADGRGVW